MNDELEHETGLDAMSKAELKAEARSRGLPTTGTKAALLERVEEHDRGDSDGDDGGQAAAPAAEDRGGAEDSSGDGSRDSGASEPSATETEGGGQEDRGPQEEDREAPDEGEAAADQEGAQAEADEGEPEAREEGEDEPEAREEGEAAPDQEGAQAEADEGEPEARAEGEDEPEAHEEDEPEAREEDEPEARDDGESAPERQGDAQRGPREQAPTAGGGGDGARPGLADVATTAARALTELTGRTVDAVSGVRRNNDGYQVTIEVLELSRVPSTTDVLATYEVDVASDGSIVEYSRQHRYYRNQTSRE